MSMCCCVIFAALDDDKQVPKICLMFCIERFSFYYAVMETITIS